MPFEKIIVLDDELVIRKTLKEQLRKRRYAIAEAETLSQAQALLQKDNFDLIFIDVGLPDGSGIELLETLSNLPIRPMVIMMTGDGSVQSAVDCMHKGAFDYIIKPFHIEQIEIAIKKAETFDQLLRVNQYVTHGQDGAKVLLGESPCVQTLREMVKKVAATEATVLISGENGTGKELIAHELYAQSPRSGKPFIKVNCAAISETLMESEFFGHEKGAFTGAMQRRQGRFELANEGTIFLDEISEISLRLQAKLLRVLQEKEFERVGGNTTLKINVRVIATTNRNLLKAVEKGDFREDLYYRLNVFPIWVPPLRERGKDILLLANSFLNHFSRKHGKSIRTFSKGANSALCAHSWPGNVRELQNTIERAVILTDSGKAIETSAFGLLQTTPKLATFKEKQVTANSLPKATVAQEELPLSSLHEIEKSHILRALEMAEGQRKKAAKMLDISVSSLQNKLDEYRKDAS